jgi:hypothetical protein
MCVLYQNISFGGAYSRMLTINIPDLNKREFVVLLTLVVPTVLFGIYPAPILDGLHESVTTLIYSLDLNIVSCGSILIYRDRPFPLINPNPPYPPSSAGILVFRAPAIFGIFYPWEGSVTFYQARGLNRSV